MKPDLARSAAGISASTNTSNNAFVAEPVAQRRAVFALRTEHGCYFANGVLVSNCDALRYGIHTRIDDYRAAA
jgi:hypothetical protein